MSSSLVSIIIPAFNASAYLSGALDSALSQTWRNSEVIVIDDGSTDDTAAIADAYAERDPRVRVLRQPNRGVATARNHGITESRGVYIAPLDADDRWQPEKLSLQMQAMQDGGDAVGLVYTWCRRVCTDGQPMRNLDETHNGNVFETMVLSNFIGCASSPLMRRECVEQAGMYSQMHLRHGGQGCEDWELALRIAENREIRCIPELLVDYNMVPGSMSRNLEGMLRSYETVMTELRARRPDLSPVLFRTSRSHFMIYLAKMSMGSGNRVTGLRYMVLAALHDPARVLSPKVLAVKCFQRLACLRRRSRQAGARDVGSHDDHGVSERNSRNRATGSAWR